MDRLIEIKVGGNHLWKDNNLAGVQGEGNVTSLRISFDEGWDGYAKSITFFDAKGRNPVKRTLTVDLLEDITESTSVYLCKIPPEPMVHAGRCSFVIEGYVDEQRQRVVETELEVLPARDTTGATEPSEPTPSQAEQLQGEIEKITEDVQTAAQSARAIMGMTVTSEMVDPSMDAGVEKSEDEDGNLNLHFSLPRGGEGPRGPEGPAGPEGPPGPRGEPGKDGSIVFEELTDEQKELLRGPTGKDGKDGYTPVKGVDYFDGKDGATGYTPVKGTDYFDGEDGQDGVSPVVSVSPITGGTRVSIKDANGTKTFDVMNGKDGAAGSGAGDMLASMYDPQRKRLDIFAYVDEKTKDIDVDVTADEVTFADGETFQQKYDSGELRGADGQPGKDGSDGVGIRSVTQTTTSNADGGTNIITVTKTDGSTSTFSVKNGSKGSDGAAGPAGSDGAPGEDGKSAYASAKDGGYTGTEAQFNSDLAKVSEADVLIAVYNQTSHADVYAAWSAGKMVIAVDAGEWASRPYYLANYMVSGNKFEFLTPVSDATVGKLVLSANGWTKSSYNPNMTPGTHSHSIADVSGVQAKITGSAGQIVGFDSSGNPVAIDARAKLGEVTLLASAWTGSGSLYSQVVTISGVTENSQVDLTPSVEQLVVFYEKDLTFVTENEGGVVTVYAIGQKPTNDYTIQVTITEVEV